MHRKPTTTEHAIKADEANLNRAIRDWQRAAPNSATITPGTTERVAMARQLQALGPRLTNKQRGLLTTIERLQQMEQTAWNRLAETLSN